MTKNRLLEMNNTLHPKLLETPDASLGFHKLPDEAADLIRGMLKAIASVGYHELFHRVSNGSPIPIARPRNSKLPRPGVNIIPGQGSSGCHPTLVAMSQGGGNRFGFDAIMRQVRTHLTHCRGITKTVIVFCDTWSAPKFQRTHFDELKALSDRDKLSFVFLMAGNPGYKITQIPVNFR